MQPEHGGADVARFYNDEPVSLPLTTWLGGMALEGTLSVSQSSEQRTLTEAQLETALKDIEVEVLNYGGQKFEVARANHRQLATLPKDKIPPGYLLHAPTYSSSISGNPGNLYELALLATQHPDMPIVYVALPGNGESSPLSKRERRLFRRSGSMIGEFNGYTVDGGIGVANLIQALDEKDIRVTRLVSNSAGVVMATAIGAMLPEGQVEQLIIENPPQLSTVALPSLVARQLWEGAVNAPRAAEATPDIWAVTPEVVKATRGIRPDVYVLPKSRGSVRARLASLGERKDRLLGQLAMLGSYAAGLALGVDGGWRHRGEDGVNPMLGNLGAFLDAQTKASG